ncbi:unnamed protein product [Adineta steineri]|uniref:Phosphoglycerate mutase n=1 Tax=Adineta steineri TaxID=433720 RepID=A0A820E6A0_9BILA|nr:unnamed protein product [Adineta steineri]
MLSSTAIRTIQTATTALETMNLDVSKLIVTPELLEQSQGQWEGLDRKSPHILEAIDEMRRLQIEYCAPEGESLRMVQKRAITYLEPLIERAKEQSIIENREISLVIFTHGGLLQSVLQYYLQSKLCDAWLIQQHNTAINEILLNENGVSLVKVNDYGHLIFSIPELLTASSSSAADSNEELKKPVLEGVDA